MRSSRITTFTVLAGVLAAAAMCGGCETSGKGRDTRGFPITTSNMKVSVHVRDGADWPVTRYASIQGEKFDIAVADLSCLNSDKTAVTFTWRAEREEKRSSLLKLDSGAVLLQGSFPPIDFPPNTPDYRFPIPWPIIFTGRISIGAEGTTFGVHTGTDLSGTPCDYVFLIEGGPLKIEAINAGPPLSGTNFPPGDLTHRRMVAQAGKVMFVKANESSPGNIVISMPKDVATEGDFSVKNAYDCINKIRRRSKLDQPFPDLQEQQSSDSAR